MKHILVALVVAATVGVAILLVRTESDTSEVRVPSSSDVLAKSVQDTPPGRLVQSSATDPTGAVGVISTESFRQLVIYAEGSPGIKVRNYELPPAAIAQPEPGQLSPYEVTEYEFSTSYRIRSVAGRQSNELYLLGQSDSGQCIIEQWTIQTLPGAYSFRRQRTQTPIGTPVAGVPATTLGIEGGVYVPAANRLRPGRQQRVELLRAVGYGKPYGITCDPEGRFVLFIAGDAPRKLYRLALEAGAHPELIAIPPSIVHLEYWSGIHAEEHVSQGRIYIAGCSVCPAAGRRSTTLLFDNDNDGNFELAQTLTLSLEEYRAAGYWGNVWISNFLTK